MNELKIEREFRKLEQALSKQRKEAGNVFGLGSRTPIAVTVLVRKSGD